MNQSELISAVSVQSDLPKIHVSLVLKALAAITVSRLYAGEEVTIPDLGKLSVKVRAARAGRNPKTGEAVQIPERVAVAFSATKALKDAINA